MPVCLYCGRLFLTQNNKIKRVTVPFYLTILNLFFATFFSDFFKYFFFCGRNNRIVRCKFRIQRKQVKQVYKVNSELWNVNTELQKIKSAFLVSYNSVFISWKFDFLRTVNPNFEIKKLQWPFFIYLFHGTNGLP